MAFMSSTDMILSQNCFLQVQRGITKKNTYSRVMVVVLCTSFYDVYDNTCMKVQRDVTQRVSKQELWFLHSACRLMLVNICM